MRLIDADALKVVFEEKSSEAVCGVELCKAIIFRINEAPTVEAEPVTRCKDCKHYYEKEWVVGGGSYTTCWYQTIANAQPNDFCSRAERKEE